MKFSSSNEGAATVDDWGRVKMTGAGEAAITLWYSSRVLYSRLSVPFPNTGRPPTRTSNSRAATSSTTWCSRSGRTCDSRRRSSPTMPRFIRRAYLDAAGILPTAEEVENFLADKSPDKRAKLVDQLLERDEFVDYWAYKWSDLLLVSSRKLNSTAMWAFYDWIRDSRQAEQAVEPVRAARSS